MMEVLTIAPRFVMNMRHKMAEFKWFTKKMVDYQMREMQG